MPDRRALVEARHEPARTVARLACARLTEDNTPAVSQELKSLAESAAGGHLVLDCSNVEYLNSTALSVLLGVHKRLRAVGGRLVLANLHPLVAEVFAVTRLDTVFELHTAA
jgi:anti-anti-sigma factor